MPPASELFDQDAEAYEGWYTTPEGKRAHRAERRLLTWLLAKFPDAESALEVGCGTGHFTALLPEHGLTAVGLDRAPAMLDVMRRLHPDVSAILGDAYEMPFPDGAFDLSVFVTALEFLDRPKAALTEAIRVSRMGVVLIVLNKWSLGGLSRRWGKQSRGSKLGRACDYSLPELTRLIQEAASERLEKTSWTGALFPLGAANLLVQLPIGSVIGMAASLTCLGKAPV